jgi:hypothetical protein
MGLDYFFAKDTKITVGRFPRGKIWIDEYSPLLYLHNYITGGYYTNRLFPPYRFIGGYD